MRRDSRPNATETEIDDLAGLDLSALRAVWESGIGPPPKLRSRELLRHPPPGICRSRPRAAISGSEPSCPATGRGGAQAALAGGQPFSRGALFHLLRNRLYLGEIRHRDTHYPGLHPAIIDCGLFDAVQERLDGKARQRGAARESVARSALTGRILDADGQAMSPTFAYGKGGKLYRYYVSAPLQQGLRRSAGDTSPRRVSAPALEDALSTAFMRLFPDRPGIDTEPRAAILRVEVRHEGVELLLPGTFLRGIDARLAPGEAAVLDPANPGQMRLTLPLRFLTGSGRTEVLAATPLRRKVDPVLVAALRAAHRMVSRDTRGRPRVDASPDTSHRRRLVRLAFLAPDLQRAILAGEQPQSLTLAFLMRADIPLTWAAQRRMFETRDSGAHHRAC